MKQLKQLLACCTVIVLLVSCGKSNTEGRYIPQDAAVAVHINGKSLSEKLPWSEIRNNPLIQDALSDSAASASVKKILSNPDSSGIQTRGDLVVFLKKDSLGGYFSFQGKLSNEAAFRAFCAEVTGNAKPVEKDGISYVSKYPVCMGWDKEKFVYTVDVPAINELTGRPPLSASDDEAPRAKVPARDIDATCRELFGLSKDQSLAKNERFTELVKETGDVHLWVNSEELNRNSPASGALSMLNLEKLYKGAITAATFSFDNGAIRLKSRSYAGEELTKLYKKYGGGELSEDMLKRMPGQEVMAVIALHFNPEGLKEFLKLLNLDGLINMGTATLGFNLDDFIKANKGDILLGLSDLKLVADTAAATDENGMTAMPKPDFNFIFAASIGDKDAFGKLIKSGEKLTSSFVNSAGAPQLAQQSDGRYFALGNSRQTVETFFSGKGNSTVSTKLAGASGGLYFNLQSLIRVFGNEAGRDSSAKKIFDASLKLWNDVLARGGAFKNGASEQTVEINLVDKNTNSLKQLNQYVITISEVIREKKRREREDILAMEDAISAEGMPDAAAGTDRK